MKVLKSFRRDGILYTPGDDPPPGLDTVTINHYRHHGMVGEPAETKPAKPRGRAVSKPAETKPAELQQHLTPDAVTADASVHTSAQSAIDSSVADPAAILGSAQPEA